MPLTEEDIIDANEIGLITDQQAAAAFEAMDNKKGVIFKGNPEDGDLRVIETDGIKARPLRTGSFPAFAAGLETGFKDIGAGGLQAGARAAEALGFDTGEFQQKVADVQTRQQEPFREQTEDFPITGGLGRIGGQVAAFAPGGSTRLGAMALGGLAGALQPTEEGQGGTAGLIQSVTGTDVGQRVQAATGIDPVDTERALNTIFGGSLGLFFQTALPAAADLIKRGVPKVRAVLSSIFETATKNAPPPGSFDAAGNPTPEFIAEIRQLGLSPDDLNTAVQAVDSPTFATPGAQRTAQTAARQARFERQGIPATRGNLSQDFGQQAEEQRLLNITSSEAAEPLRQRVLQQSQAFEAKVGELVDSLGIPKEAGDNIKLALQGRKRVSRKIKNRLYRKAGKASPDVLDLPIFVDDILDAMPDVAKQRRIARNVPDQANALNSLLVEFGIDTSEEAVEKFVKEGGEITPLTLRNFEDFRQAINLIERSNLTKDNILVLTGPIKRALDTEGEAIQKATRDAGIDNPEVISILKEARSRVRQLKTEFSPQSIGGKLINTQRDGFTPVTEASKIMDKFLIKSAPIEELKRVLSSLSKSGKKGKRAIGDMQAAVVMDALESGLSAPSRKIQGVGVASGNQFSKALGKFGDDKLDLLFSNNKAALKKLRDLRRTGLDIEPAAGAIPKGSAPVLMDIANAMRPFLRLPGIAPFTEGLKFVIKAGSDERAVARALKTNPKIFENIRALELDFPALANAIGVRSVLATADKIQTNEATQ